MPFLRVALDVPIPALFDYQVVDGADCLGRRVIVPFGRKSLVGVVLEVADTTDFDPAKVKAVREVLRDTPPLPAAWLELLRFCASYYQHPLGAAALSALPGKFKLAQAFDPLLWTRLRWVGAAPDLPRRERVKTMLAGALAESARFGCDLVSASPKALHYLAEWQAAGFLSEAAAPELVVADAPVLNPEQQAAADAITAAIAASTALRLAAAPIAASAPQSVSQPANDGVSSVAAASAGAGAAGGGVTAASESGAAAAIATQGAAADESTGLAGPAHSADPADSHACAMLAGQAGPGDAAAHARLGGAGSLPVASASNGMANKGVALVAGHAAHLGAASSATSGAAVPGYTPFLLHGVTGSGKTEVYLHVTAQALRRGRQVLIMVPEINLTPRLLDNFRQRFPASRIVALHSALNESERLHHWLLAHTGAADIVLGTRLAILCSMPRLGLIVVDEEHDPSFKQQEGMRYSARDLSVFRAKNEGVPVVLGSATPALETYAHALSGRYTRLLLKTRAVPEAALPRVSLIDLNLTPVEHGIAAPIWAAIRTRLERGEQSLVFLNRRGFAPVLSCPSCGWVSACLRCTSYLVLHRGRGMLTGGKLVCHHCGWEEKVPEACPTCGNIDIRAYGQGTQRLESQIAEANPTARVLRIDRDSTARKGEAEALLGQAHAGEVDILVGTQMLAKGHDFKNLTLVAAVNVDSALFSADFRASERLFAQLMQVAGRAGRAEKPGEVLIQTRKPDHPLFQSVIAADYDRFAQSLLRERQSAGLPPAAFQAMLRVEAAKLDTALDFLKAAAQSGVESSGVTLYDPVPMNLTRLMNVERAQLMAESPSRPALQAFLTRWVEWLYDNAPRSVRWHVEVDPLEI